MSPQSATITVLPAGPTPPPADLQYDLRPLLEGGRTRQDVRDGTAKPRTIRKTIKTRTGLRRLLASAFTAARAHHADDVDHVTVAITCPTGAVARELAHLLARRLRRRGVTTLIRTPEPAASGS